MTLPPRMIPKILAMLTTQLTCDKCERRFGIDDARAGDKVQCPICGDVNVIRASQVIQADVAGTVPAPSSSDAAVAAGYPSKTGPEADVLRLRPAMMRARPGSFFLLMLGAVGGAIGAVISGVILMVPLLIGCAIVALACIICLTVWRINTHHDGLLITTRRIIDREGLLSKNTSEIMLKDIRHVTINQTFWDRVWNVGTLSLSSSADDGVEIHMENLAKPLMVKGVIDMYR